MTKIPVFDIGDTLLPSHEKINETVHDKVVEAGVENPPAFPINDYNIYVPGEIQEWLDKHGIKADPVEIKQAYIEWEKDFLQASVIPELKKINEEFGPIGFISDNSVKAKEFYAEIFQEEGLNYSVMTVSEKVGVEKPDPEIFRAFIKQRDEKTEDFVYFGNYVERDSAAEKVGMSFVWVTQYYTFGEKTWNPEIESLTVENVSRAIEEVKK